MADLKYFIPLFKTLKDIRWKYIWTSCVIFFIVIALEVWKMKLVRLMPSRPKGYRSVDVYFVHNSDCGCIQKPRFKIPRLSTQIVVKCSVKCPRPDGVTVILETLPYSVACILPLDSIYHAHAKPLRSAVMWSHCTFQWGSDEAWSCLITHLPSYSHSLSSEFPPSGGTANYAGQRLPQLYSGIWLFNRAPSCEPVALECFSKWSVCNS